jgi:hypothetical protein
MSYLMKKPRDYAKGLRMIGFPNDKIDELSEFLKNGKLPHCIPDTVIQRYDELDLHPDQYPWEAYAFDELADGLEDAGFDTETIWKNASEYVKKTYNKSMPSACATDLGTTEALTNLLEFYSLLAYHDIKELRKKSELHF